MGYLVKRRAHVLNKTKRAAILAQAGNIINMFNMIDEKAIIHEQTASPLNRVQNKMITHLQGKALPIRRLR